MPGGDLVTAALAAYIAARASTLGIPRITMLRMWANVGVDAIMGSVPIVGDIADTFFKANKRNVNYVLQYFGRTPLATRRHQRGERSIRAGGSPVDGAAVPAGVAPS
jgi:hypothetical protein